MLKIRYSIQEFFVRGDTYEHRGLLKHLGFRWDPRGKLWHRSATEQETLDYILSMFHLNNVCFEHDGSIKFYKKLTVEQVTTFKENLKKLKEKLKDA